jgi:hypothetical protein
MCEIIDFSTFKEAQNLSVEECEFLQNRSNQAVRTTFYIAGIFVLMSLFPSEAKALEQKLRQVKDKPEMFYDENLNREVTKLYTEFDFREQKVVKKAVKKAVKKVVKTLTKVNQQKGIQVESVEFILPPIDIIKLFQKQKQQVVNIQLVESKTFFEKLKIFSHKNKDKILLLKGGFIGYLFGKIGEKISEQAKKGL